MKDITKKEMELVLFIFKNPEKEHNANNIASKINITPMGALKIMKKLDKQGILKAKKIGKAVFYKINFSSDMACKAAELSLFEEGHLRGCSLLAVGC